MSEKAPQYRMNKLMNYKELDAFTAQKKAGSSSAYFTLLAEFTENAPGLLVGLEPPVDEVGHVAFVKKIYSLQKRLFAIGSSPLMWLAEKVIETARSGNTAKCEDDLLILSSRVRALCAQLDEAKGEPTAAEKGAAFTPEMPPQVENASRPKASVTPEQFEKLNILVENFEMDDAMAMLRSLSSFTYGKEVDSLLAGMCMSLVKFDYGNAAAQSKRLLELARATTADAGKAANKKILAVDDVPDVLNTIKSVLKSDYAVYGVTNHMSALKFLTSNSADLILLDIEMPDMNGFALLGIIRKIKVYETTPVIFLTGNVSVENIRKAHSAGANDFIKKPVESKVLLEKIAKHLGAASK